MCPGPGTSRAAAAVSHRAAPASFPTAWQVEKLSDPVSPVEEVLRRCPAKQLMQLYKIAKFEGVDQFLQLIASARGAPRWPHSRKRVDPHTTAGRLTPYDH